MDADQLARAEGRVLKAVVPEGADEALETRWQRQAEAAHRQRSLRFFVEGASVRFDGSLPRAAERLVTPEIRDALNARDRGCVFPGCDAPPSRCEAHHWRPWEGRGGTSLRELVLQCHSHHPLVESARHGVRDQWQVRVAADGLPEFIPPVRVDPQQKRIRHARHQRAPGGSGWREGTCDTGRPEAA